MNQTQSTAIPAQRSVERSHPRTEQSRLARLAVPEVDRSAIRLWLFTPAERLPSGRRRAWILGADNAVSKPISYLARWNQWDTVHYTTIAQFGYGGDPSTRRGSAGAFFPGYPMLLRCVHTVTGLGYVPAGLLISLVCGGVASVALARIALDYVLPGVDGTRLAERTVLVFLIAPTTVFLSAAYTESLFLASP